MLEIVKLPTPSLRECSTKIERKVLLSAEIQKLIKDIVPTMHNDDGIGLAAPQVGKNIRLCVVGKEATPEKKADLILINPEWIKTNRKKVTNIEGCLSVPKTYGKVKRYRDIEVKSWNEKGEIMEFDAHDFFARVIQHEVDHLDGILFIDKAKDVYTVE